MVTPYRTLRSSASSYHRGKPATAKSPPAPTTSATLQSLEDAGQRLFKLKASELKEKLQTCGLGTVGSKSVLVERLLTTLQPSSLDTSTQPSVPKQPRDEIVVSIDIGFRNLAYAVVSTQRGLTAWRTVDLAEDLEVSGLIQSPWATAQVVQNFVHRVLPTPAQMLREASRVVYIIERQRFRTVGFEQIPDAVLFINLIEPLIYANLINLGARPAPALTYAHLGESPLSLAGVDPTLAAPVTTPGDPRQGAFVHPVNPATVSSFFNLNQRAEAILAERVEKRKPSGKAVTTSGSKARSKLAKKKASIQLITEYVDQVNQGPTILTDPRAVWTAGTRDVPLLPISPALEQGFRDSRKKDDMTDCLLQALAWLAWQSARDAESQGLFGTKQ
ncbi:hypothetical protein IWQ60_000428 [Tieghemiomyces parasiticus]|uniref:SAP domain-containing protein n=1 Tax=Tieghemiomyces parasiticus TaxID=78921 RepID=A0A9W8AEV4_9FUNG|nr:hypothetical protein IWQ60_000428 [Tieghemiomyces parasiticus]